MNYKVILSPVAKADIRQAVKYYTLKVSETVAENFLSELENAIKVIAINPFFQVYYKENRGLPMRKFPYIIIFKVDKPEQTVFVKAIFHTSQNPEKYPE